MTPGKYLIEMSASVLSVYVRDEYTFASKDIRLCSLFAAFRGMKTKLYTSALKMLVLLFTKSFNAVTYNL